MSSRSQCVCGECAEQFGHISPVSSTFTECYIVHTVTKAHEALSTWEGDQCDLDHNHEKSKSCSIHYQCDGCGEIHESDTEAGECCERWECNFCGETFTSGYYGSGKSHAAECCAQTCDECEAYGWPDFIADHTCNTGMGTRRQLPWEARGIVVNAQQPEGGQEWKDVWGLDPEQHDVVQAAANFYLLEAMSAGLVGTTDGKGNVDRQVTTHPSMNVLLDEAKAAFTTLVDIWDPMLQAYTHMACGGELRHHTSVGGAALSSDRDTAWNGWKLIYEAVGPDALTDAADLFNEFGGGSFGGKPWADACLILHARVTDSIPPRVFLDRIFNAQHNGGVLLNKVAWKGEVHRYSTPSKYLWSINELQSTVLPAHGADPEPDYSTLLAYASAAVRELFADFYQVANAAKRDLGLTGPLAVRPRKGYTATGRYRAQQKQAEAKQAALDAAPKSVQFKAKAEGYDEIIKQYAKYAKREAKQNARYQAKLESGEMAGCGCGVSGCNAFQSTYYQDSLASYQEMQESLYKKAMDWEKMEIQMTTKYAAAKPAKTVIADLDKILAGGSW
jgi:hypothetical protein